MHGLPRRGGDVEAPAPPRPSPRPSPRPHPAPPPASAYLFPLSLLSSPPAPCRGTQAPCGVACGGGREGESVVGGARAQAQRGGRAYARGAARRARPCRLAPSASPNSLRRRGAAAARPRGAVSQWELTKRCIDCAMQERTRNADCQGRAHGR